MNTASVVRIISVNSWPAGAWARAPWTLSGEHAVRFSSCWMVAS